MADAQKDMYTADTSLQKFFFVWLAPGVTKPHMWVFLYAAFSTIGLLTFISTGTALVLNANLGIPISQQGEISGNLVVATEIMQIIVFGVVGVLADRIGRRELFAIGMFVMGLSYGLYPFAESLPELFLYRVIYAAGLGAATGMLGTLIADYPQDVSRAKAIGLGGFLNGLGVIVVTAFMGRLLPPALVNMGYDDRMASIITHEVMFAWCAISAVIIFFGTRKGPPVDKGELVPWRELVLSGFKEGRNPRIALSYAAAFVARSDLVILGTFTVLWGTTAAVSQGMGVAEGTALGAKIFVISAISAQLWIIVLGVFMDRFNSVTGTIFCMALAAIGYSAQLLVENPLDPAATPYFILLGIGQISAFFGATRLVSQEAPRLTRGAVIGMFNMSGAIGILIMAAIGGRMFDVYGGAAPFGLVGAVNAIVMVLAIIVRIKAPGPMPVRKGQQPAVDA